MNEPLPSSKNCHFQTEAKNTPFLVKMRFFLHENGFALSLTLRQLGNGLFKQYYWTTISH